MAHFRCLCAFAVTELPPPEGESWGKAPPPCCSSHLCLFPSFFFIRHALIPFALRSLHTLGEKCEGVQCVLSQSVTKASLDAWRVHSSLLSPGCSVPNHLLLYTHIDFYTQVSRHNHILYTTLTPTIFSLHYWPFSTANISGLTVKRCLLQFRSRNFSILCNFSTNQFNLQHVWACWL